MDRLLGTRGEDVEEPGGRALAGVRGAEGRGCTPHASKEQQG